ncbi:hypothetical protein ACFC53_00810 [Enterococcus casseliflavus]|uniref:hypothetical protein n=1 Tax=Enterococcus TaxID=1350 RepID=UPI00289A8B92|nr:hypothetical protein [Enterococcus sp.]
MAKYLFLLGSYYPKPSANGICVQNICDSLIEQGHEVYIICENESDKNENVIQNNCNIYMTKPRVVKLIKYKQPMFSQLNSFLHFLTWPVTSNRVVYNFYKNAIEIIDKYNIENLICVCNPFETIVVGDKIKKNKKNINVYFYFLDAFFFGKKPKWMTKDTYDLKTQKYALDVFNCADKIIFMKNHSIPQTIQKKYGKKIIFLDIPLFKDNMWNADSNMNKVPVFLYLGNFVTGLREPDFLFEILWGLFKAGFKFKAYFYGNLYGMKIPSFAKEMKDLGIIYVESNISHAEALNKMEKADILINVESNNSNFIPSKIFEYISTGKTILNVTDSNNEVSLNYLKKYKRFLSFSKSEPVDFYEAASNIEDMILIKNSSEFSEIKEVFRDNTPDMFINAILKGY